MRFASTSFFQQDGLTFEDVAVHFPGRSGVPLRGSGMLVLRCDAGELGTPASLGESFRSTVSPLSSVAARPSRRPRGKARGPRAFAAPGSVCASCSPSA
ncbi:hypothetical protein AB1E18_013934 [Capra hircus]